MTYFEHGKKLHDEFAENTRKFLKLDAEIMGTSGFADLNLAPNYMTEYEKWQTSGARWNSFISFIIKYKVDLNSEITNSHTSF